MKAVGHIKKQRVVELVCYKMTKSHSFRSNKCQNSPYSKWDEIWHHSN